MSKCKERGEQKYEKLNMGIHSDLIVYWSFTGICCVVRDTKCLNLCTC